MYKLTLKHRIANRAADLLAFMLRRIGKGGYKFFLDAMWHRYAAMVNPNEEVAPKLYFPDPVDPERDEKPIVERVFAAFQKSKQAQKDWKPELLPASGWQNVIDNAYVPLCEALETGDLETFHYFLANFLSWQRPTGIEVSHLVHKYSLDERKKRYFERQVMQPLLHWWARTESHGRDFTALALPDIANPCGVLVDGTLVSLGSIFSDIYARTLVAMVSGDRPVIAELGGGFGRLIYFMSGRLSGSCYLNFDLPETLCCSSYFLMRAFPHKKVLLYGEGELTADSLQSYDFILMPPTEVSKLESGSIDLFINENSLGEMRGDTCRYYVKEICRVSDQFWHRNHEARRFDYADGESSLLNQEYPVPREAFDLCGRYCDVGTLIGEGRFNVESDMFCYHYRRYK